MVFVYGAPSEFSKATVRRTADPLAAAELGNTRLTTFDELPATMSPRIGEGNILVAGTPFKDADVSFTPVAVPNPAAVPTGVAVTRIG
jgi:hypothetical protein